LWQEDLDDDHRCTAVPTGEGVVESIFIIRIAMLVFGFGLALK
jgi:hypothetical protein